MPLERLEPLEPIRVVEPFDAFYRRERRGLVALAYPLTGNADVADDLAHEALTAAGRRWDEIGALELPIGWVRRVVANRSTSFVRRRIVEAKALPRLISRATTTPVTAVSTTTRPFAAVPIGPGSILTTEAEYVIREGDDPATVATLWAIRLEDLATLNGWTLQEGGIVPEWPGVGATIRVPAGATVPGGVDDADTLAVDVFEQEMQVTITSDFTCDEPSTSPGFDTFSLSLFSDRAVGRWLMRATLPDLSTFDLVATGSVLYPTTLHARGTWSGVDTGCAVFGPQQMPGVMIGEGAIVPLNLEDELTDTDRPFFAGDVDPAATRYGDGRVSTTGWPGTGWVLVEPFVYTASDMVVRGIEQTTRWIVGVDGTVVERTFENRMEGLGASTVTISMLGFGETMIDAASFGTSDARPLVPHERPAGPDDGLGTTERDSTPSTVATCGTYTVIDGDVPAAVATKLDTTFGELVAVNVDTPGWDQWFPGLVINVPC